MLSGRFQRSRKTYSMYPLYNCTGSLSELTALPPPNSKDGSSAGGGATTGAAAGGGAEAVLGGSIFGASTTLGGSTFGVSGLGGSFGLGGGVVLTICTEIFCSFLPRYPSRAAK